MIVILHVSVSWKVGYLDVVIRCVQYKHPQFSAQSKFIVFLLCVRIWTYLHIHAYPSIYVSTDFGTTQVVSYQKRFRWKNELINFQEKEAHFWLAQAFKLHSGITFLRFCPRNKVGSTTWVGMKVKVGLHEKWRRTGTQRVCMVVQRRPKKRFKVEHKATLVHVHTPLLLEPHYPRHNEVSIGL